ncbi:hypothetical protein GCM10009862_12870 [Microbacterium binotii]|jgi:hypothetical protein|uniref:Uncharacterized protein n=1 Tax=Microbacterium binotii TaxID=462710 RepID=A0ABN3PBU2_9MICO
MRAEQQLALVRSTVLRLSGSGGDERAQASEYRIGRIRHQRRTRGAVSYRRPECLVVDHEQQLTLRRGIAKECARRDSGRRGHLLRRHRGESPRAQEIRRDAKDPLPLDSHVLLAAGFHLPDARSSSKL